jgi:SAM-dependent MidA family methyltransferase
VDFGSRLHTAGYDPQPLIQIVHERGPLTVAAFMDLALYHPQLGYYAHAAQRSGRAGDFFTSVDVGAVFGELLEVQIAEMVGLLASNGDRRAFDLIEAGAGNGRLAADLLRAAAQRHPDVYAALRLHLVEASATARAAHESVLGNARDRLATSSDQLPERFSGALVANELLDAMPVHQVVMRASGLREIYVTVKQNRLVTKEGGLSTPDLQAYFDNLDLRLKPGWRVEVNLRAREWMSDVARRLDRGFVILIDYGHEAHHLYSAAHASGTLTTFARHTMAGPETSAAVPPWLVHPGAQDITAHVDFTTIRRTAEAAGMTVLGLLDQTYFLMGLLEGADIAAGLPPAAQMKQRLALKTLLLPGGLGSTFKVLLLGKGVGAPPLKGCSYRVRVT